MAKTSFHCTLEMHPSWSSPQPPVRQFKTARSSPTSCCFFQPRKSVFWCCYPFSAYISHPGTFLLVVACQLTCFCTSLSSPCWGAQNWAQYSMHSVTNTKKKEQTFSRPAAYIFFNLTGGAVDVRHHKSTLLPRRPFWQSSFWGSPPPACLASAGPRCRCLPLRCTGLPTARPIVPQILPSWPQACGLPSSSHHQTSPVTKMIGKPQIWQLPQAPSGPMDKRTSSLLACSLTPSSSSTHNASV